MPLTHRTPPAPVAAIHASEVAAPSVKPLGAA
jgi:hypothetical protein